MKQGCICSIRLMLCIILCLFYSVSEAGEFTINDISARGQSMQAYAAVADDPSAVFYNPAGLTQVKGTQVQGNLIYVSLDQKYTNRFTNTSSHSYPTVLAPTFFVSTDKLKKVVLGFGVYSPFARSADYKKNSAVYFLNQKSNLVRTDFSAIVAFNINKYISIGVGPVASRVIGYTDILGFSEKGDGIGYTGQGGILIKLPKAVRLALTYRGHEFVRFDGHGKLAGIRDKFSAGFDFPAIMTVGASWWATHRLLLSANYDYEYWSTLKTFRRKYDNPVLNAIGTTPINSRNSATYRFGVRFNVNENNQLSAGISYINAGVPSTYIVPALPDYDGTNSSIGYSHQFSKKLRMDTTYVYIHGPDRHSNNAIFPGVYSVKGNVFMVGVNYQV